MTPLLLFSSALTVAVLPCAHPACNGVILPDSYPSINSLGEEKTQHPIYEAARCPMPGPALLYRAGCGSRYGSTGTGPVYSSTS